MSRLLMRNLTVTNELGEAEAMPEVELADTIVGLFFNFLSGIVDACALTGSVAFEST